jgi:hypothetical protein
MPSDVSLNVSSCYEAEVPTDAQKKSGHSDGNTAENSSSVLLSQSMYSKETTLGLLQLEDEGITILRFGNYVFTN